jgi:hypothetical protein
VSYISSTADTSVFLQVLSQIDPANVTAVSLMNDVFNNQLQLAASVLSLQKYSAAQSGDTEELTEVVAMLTLPQVQDLTTQIKESL